MNNYSTVKVFTPRLASQAIWNNTILKWSGRSRFISWFVSDDEENLDITSLWLITNGAERGEIVILDMS